MILNLLFLSRLSTTFDNEVIVTARGAVSKSLKKGTYRGAPCIPIDKFQRNEVHVRRLSEYAERIKKLEATLNELVASKKS